MMELNDIKIFLELYQNRSISKTAEKLHYTQSNISTRLMKLEQEFNTPLFIRTKSGLQLQKDTERFYIHAKKMEAALQDLYQEFSMPIHEINTGSTQLLSRLYFPALYLQNHVFSLHTANSKKLCRDFTSHMYDLIITHTTLDADADMLCYEKTENLSWASSANFMKPGNSVITVVINRDKSCPLRKLSLDALKLASSDCPVIEVDTLDIMITLLCSSNCIALLPQKIISDDKRLAACNLLPPDLLHVYLYCNANIDTDMIKAAFVQPFSFALSADKT